MCIDDHVLGSSMIVGDQDHPKDLSDQASGMIRVGDAVILDRGKIVYQATSEQLRASRRGGLGTFLGRVSWARFLGTFPGVGAEDEGHGI